MCLLDMLILKKHKVEDKKLLYNKYFILFYRFYIIFPNKDENLVTY